jgi:IS605 OrfB family transposase
VIRHRRGLNGNQSPEGYRQRCFEIKQDRNDGKWWLFATYDFPAKPAAPDTGTVVGVDLGVSLPLYAALNNGHARLGHRQFHALGRRIRTLQNQVDARRRSIQRGGRQDIASNTARSGHGRKRNLMPTEKLMGRISKAYQTLNHQLSAAVIAFARNHGAGIIQIEDLTSLKDELTGTFLGRRWRYHQLQQFLKYKAAEAGIELKTVNPKYTSRRCSECGHIHIAFDRDYRDSHRSNGKPAPFVCPECGYEADADYNAARNLATLDIAARIELQCQHQEIEYSAL